MKKTHPIASSVSNMLIDLPSPCTISGWWNFGSLLRACLTIQLLSGLFLAMRYTGDVNLAFRRVSHINTDVENGWIARTLHANGASFFFICLYAHIGRGLYYGSYVFQETWVIGVIILLLVIGAAFLGYVLPWGQISFWGTSVITGLLTAIPWVGEDIAICLWGGFSVNNPTLTRFFVFHFVVPFVITALVVVHLVFLHETGSNNPLGLTRNLDKVPFHLYFSYKDILGLILILLMLFMLTLISPWIFGDPENFIVANSLVTPIHIQPEWYFLFAYAILRSTPNKLGGVLALVFAVIILLIIPIVPKTKFSGNMFCWPSQLFFWGQVNCVLLLTWIGASPVEEPYVMVGQILSFCYFRFYLMERPLKSFWLNSLTCN